MRDSNFVSVWALEAAAYSLEYRPWTAKSPRELVWGYEEPLFELAKMALPNPPEMSHFGYFTDVSLP